MSVSNTTKTKVTQCTHAIAMSHEHKNTPGDANSSRSRQ